MQQLVERAQRPATGAKVARQGAKRAGRENPSARGVEEKKQSQGQATCGGHRDGFAKCRNPRPPWRHFDQSPTPVCDRFDKTPNATKAI